MTTLIELRFKDGRLISRCDAKCYNAKGETCICACGGANHGEGLDQAIQNTNDWKDNLKRIEKESPIKGISQGLVFFPRKAK